MEIREQERVLAEADRLYEQYAKPLEPEHWGEFIAISRDGKTLLGESLDEIAQKAIDVFGSGKGVRVFRIGPRAAGRL